MRWTRPVIFSFLLAVLLVGCGNGPQPRHAFDVSLVGLPDSAVVGGHYEGWGVVNGVARSTGKFVVLGTGPAASIESTIHSRVYGTAGMATFGPAATLLGERFPRMEKASHWFVTVEPDGDFDAVPSCQVILAGALVGNAATLSSSGVVIADPTFPCVTTEGTGYRLGLGDLGSAGASFVMRSPTDDVANPAANDFAGVWFGDEAGSLLNLPSLPGSFVYEAWADVDGEERSLGTFTPGSGKDSDAATHAQRHPDSLGFDHPGQDFVIDDVPSVAFDPPVLDLATEVNFPMEGDFETFITLEPALDNDRGPFGLTLLTDVIPPEAITAAGTTGGLAALDVADMLPTAEVLVTPGSMRLDDVTLPELGAGADDARGHYELWVSAGTADPESVARFWRDGDDIVNAADGSVIGTVTSVDFTAASTGNLMFPVVSSADTCFVTLECQGDGDDTPSSADLVGASLSGGIGTLTVVGLSEVGGPGVADFTEISGQYRLGTPTDDSTDDANDAMGILFRTLSSFDSNAVSLVLPDLPASAGWVYEGWVRDRMTGEAWSTGRFVGPVGPDRDHAANPSEGPDDRPPFPGRDFVNAVPTVMRSAAGASSITAVRISIESVPDNAPSPYLPVFSGTVPSGATAGGVSTGPVPLSNVSGSVSGTLVVDVD